MSLFIEVIMPGNGNLDTQINWLENDVKAHKHIEAYPLWIRLVGVLSSMGNEIEAMVVGLRGDGNGNKGALQRLTAMEGVMKSMQSDIRDLRNLVRISLGIEHDPEALEKIPRFTAEDHPARRAEDSKTLSDKLLGVCGRAHNTPYNRFADPGGDCILGCGPEPPTRWSVIKAKNPLLRQGIFI